ncbi:MAG: bifunctional DNA-formamidopyrimidine glycosylase/DNA-(apurinic or apyrimidinic site) lyase [Rhodospirillales bacterium]|nr:bifunctional DNA-formamidopyrimidine glycosylase/DNA-(apurinic or apyrimidinic site) lyase [Acetobacter sp.]
MPELPEVETVASGVHARVAGLHVTGVWTSGKPQTFKSTETELVQALTGVRISRVRRVGKTIVADLNRPAGSEVGTEQAQLLVHLGMTGRLLVSPPDTPWPPHTHLVLTLSDGRELRFTDARRFGRISLVRDPRGYLGPGAEPTTISLDAFAALFRGRKLAIKAALLNQSLLHGIGNIYADEALFRAGIRPRRSAGRLTKAELGRLHHNLQQVLAKAIQLGGSSVSDYVDATGVRGFFQQQHKVYGHAGEPCQDCATQLKKIIVGGRTTVYCRQCQK